MLPPSSTSTLLLWTAVAALSGFGVGFYVASRPGAPKAENSPNEGTGPPNSDSEDDTNDSGDIAKIKAGILEPCKMARTLHSRTPGVPTIFVDPRGENRLGDD